MNRPLHPPDDLVAAARLLVAIAGPLPVHIEMSARGPKKYYEVQRAFAERDGRLHLAGWRTKGATLRYPDGMTRALCYDADAPTDWQRLQEAARALAACGYAPLLETSPVGRGGHLWIIYSGLVEASWAQHHAMALAPELQEIRECWPGAAHKVRLPGGKYVQPGFAAWCTLADAAGTVLATDGASAARVLLDFQTAAEVVPASPVAMSLALQGGERVDMPNRQEQEAERHERSLGQVDSRWYEQYGRSLWFQFTPGQLAALYNERHPLPELLPLEQNGMAFSPSVEEHTPSTAITKDGLAWVDFSARTSQPGGKHDGGDALELVARRNGETKANKRGTMQQAARALVREAKAALEEAARAGLPPPSWVASIMTEAGWQHYQRLCDAGQCEIQAAARREERGVHQATAPNEAPRQTTEQRRVPLAPAMADAPHDAKQKHDSPEALAAELSAEIGEPCQRCGCIFYYQSEPYRMCHWCLPRPARFGRLSGEQRARLQAFLPRNR
jgi:hypothetical protein